MGWVYQLPKLITLAAVLTYLLAFGARLRIPSRPFLILFLVYLLRDIVYAFVPLDSICLAADILSIFSYLYWLRGITGKRKSDNVMILVGIVASLGAAEQDFFGLLPGLLFFRSVWIVPLFVYLWIQLAQVTPFNTRRPETVLQNKAGIRFIFFALIVFTMALGYHSLYLHTLVYPAIYIFHAIILYRLTLARVAQKDLTATSLIASRDSLFSFMQELSSAVSEKMEINKILSLVVRSAIRNTGADGGAILMVDEMGNELRYRAIVGTYSPPFKVPEVVKTRAARLEDYLYSTGIKFGETILGESFQRAEPLFVQNTRQDERLAEDVESNQLDISSLIVVPLIVSKRILGIISVGKQSWGQFFTDEDFEHLKAFADYASLSIDMHLNYLEVLEKRQLDHELGIAAEIQKKLVPRDLPLLKAAEIAVHSVPARGVSGDYYDIFHLDSQKLIITVGDVAGKGVPAALVMVMIHSIFHLIASPKRDIATTLTWINRGLFGQIEIDHFATLSILSYDETTHSIQYSNAAHHPLLIYRVAVDEIESVDTEGLPIGIDRASLYKLKNLSLQSGDIALIYTDGIVEAMNPEGEQYSLDRLSSVLRSNKNKGAEELKKAIEEDLGEFTGTAKQHDDQTLVILKAN